MLHAGPETASTKTTSPTLYAQNASPAETPAAPGNPTAQANTPQAKPNRAEAYLHYSLAHMYEEMVATYGRSEYASKAIEEYRLAIQADPTSSFLTTGLADLYWRTGRIRDAVVEAQELLKRDPNNLDAHRLLGRIYIRSVGGPESGSQSAEMLKLAIEQYENVVRLDPKSIEDRLLLGRLYRVNNQSLKAEEQFKAAVQQRPDSEEAVTMLAMLYNDEGDSSRAEQVLASVPDSERSARIYSTLGYTYEGKKDYKKAIQAYRKSIELDKDNLDSVRGLAQNLLNDGQVEAALEQYQAIVEADPSDAQSYMHIAEIDRRNGRFDQALEALKKAAALVQDSQEVPYNIAIIYQAQGRYDEAIQTIQQLLQKTDKDASVQTKGDKSNRSIFLERLGNIYRESGRTQQAVDTFRQMIPISDESASRAYQEIIDTYRDARDWPAATAAAQEGASKLPNDRGLKLMLASQLADQGQAEPALAQAKTLLKGDGEDREIYIALAQMYSRLKRWTEGEQMLAKAEQLSSQPEEKKYILFVRGSMYERQKKYDLAEESFRKVLAMDPKNAMALNYLGYMLADRGTRLEEALGMLRKAVQFDPQNGAYLDSLGWVYYKLGNYVLAEENLRKAAAKVGNDPTVQDHLGELYLKTGQIKQAIVHWERALNQWGQSVPAEVDPEDVAKVQKKLESAKIKLAQQQPRK